MIDTGGYFIYSEISCHLFFHKILIIYLGIFVKMVTEAITQISNKVQ